MGAAVHRRLVVMFDGTWNELEDWTNIARMKEAIDVGIVANGVEQQVGYFPGVGTGWVGKIIGGVMGYGLSEIIKEGYHWLSKNYREGDEVFVFGFSRGAYSARSLVSLIHKCRGVLKKPTNDLVDQAYNLYRNDKLEIYDERVSLFGAQHCVPLRVKMLGVWDTVGALGIPDSVFRAKSFWHPLLAILGKVFNMSRSHYRFHSQGLPCIVDEAYHALAIDEHREDFAPTLWDKVKPENQVMEQTWFVGSHANVGGGVVDDDLWQLSYEWMQDKAIAAGLRYKWTYKAGEQWPHWLTETEDSFALMIGGWYARFKHFKRFNRIVGGSCAESLHPSVKARIQNSSSYVPEALRDPGNPAVFRTEVPYISPPVIPCNCQKPLVEI